MNQFVKFKLTDEGKEILRRYDELPIESNEDGYYVAQLHDVASIFSGACELGETVFFLTDLEFLD